MEHDYKAIADWLANYVATDAPTPPDYVRNYLLGQDGDTKVDVYVLVGEDRHTDVEVQVFTDEVSAVRAARQFVQDNARVTKDELDLDPEDSELNEDMRADGWVYFEIYSCEGDSVRVVRRVLDDDRP